MSSFTQENNMKAGNLLSAAALIAAASPAYGQIVAFENDGSFEWGLLEAFDITVSAAEQPGVSGTLGQGGYAYSGNYGSYGYTYLTTSGGNAAGIVVFDPPNAGVSSTRVVGLSSGAVIDGARNFGTFGYIFPRGYLGLTSLVPEGQASYLGVALDLGDPSGQFNYGWVKVERDQFTINALAWGYNTVAGEAIEAGQIPTPGTLGALAFGAVVANKRKRRAS